MLMAWRLPGLLAGFPFSRILDLVLHVSVYKKATRMAFIIIFHEK